MNKNKIVISILFFSILATISLLSDKAFSDIFPRNTLSNNSSIINEKAEKKVLHCAGKINQELAFSNYQNKNTNSCIFIGCGDFL